MTTDESGRELDEALAREAGWTEIHWNQGEEIWGTVCYFEPHFSRLGVRPDGRKSSVPAYHASIDDTLRDHWPELQRRHSGWPMTLVMGYSPSDGKWWTRVTIGKAYYDGAGDTLATALARACLAAYREGRE